MSFATSPTSLADMAEQSGLRRVHMLAWRDLADDEAGGSEVHASTVARLWAEAGIEVTMRTSAAPGLPATAERHGYNVIRRAGRFSVFPRGIAAEIAGRHGRRDGLVEIWNGVPWLSPVWARGPKVTWLHHVHGPMWNQVLPRPFSTLGRLVEARLAPPFYRHQTTITLSESSRSELLHHGFHADRVKVVPPGIDPTFSPGGEKADHPLIVAVGRLMPVKSLDVLISAIAPLAAAFPGLELVIVGEGAERARLTSIIDALPNPSVVRLAGRIDTNDLVRLYRRAWLLTSASIAEGWGMTITEAAACGTPAVVTDIGGHRDAVVNGRSGILAAPADLADAVARVLGDASLRADLGTGALARATELTWHQTALRTFGHLADTTIGAIH